jgi:hypothetical protein
MQNHRCSVPILLSLPPNGFAEGVFGFEPGLHGTALVGRVQALRHDALQTKAAGVFEYGGAVVSDMIHVNDHPRAAAQNPRQVLLPVKERFFLKVVGVKLDQVEGGRARRGTDSVRSAPSVENRWRRPPSTERLPLRTGTAPLCGDCCGIKIIRSGCAALPSSPVAKEALCEADKNGENELAGCQRDRMPRAHKRRADWRKSERAAARFRAE